MLKQVTSRVLALLPVVAVWCGTALAEHKSTPFEGVKANTGHVILDHDEGKLILELSDDFMVPDAPDPHWQVVDSKGNVYLLNRLDIKGERTNTLITAPAYVRDVAKVQIWCAWAEALLGEARFDPPAVALAKKQEK